MATLLFIQKGCVIKSMSSYHHSVTYKDKNSLEEGLIIVAFEPDNGFMDSFLGMDNVSDDYYDGTKKFNYGSKYNSSAEIKISFIKKDKTDMTMSEFRSYARWLTGARTDSWLDMYDGTIQTEITEKLGNGNTAEFELKYPYSILKVTVNGVETKKYKRLFTNDILGNIPMGTLIFEEAPADGTVIKIYETSPTYSFLGKITNLEQYKYDARTTGIRVTFSSMAPWAFSAPQNFKAAISQALGVNENGVIGRWKKLDNSDLDGWLDEEDKLGFENGIVVLDKKSDKINFNIFDNGVAYIDTKATKYIDNQTDDLYTYIYLDIDYLNQSCDEVSIKNETLNEESIIKNIETNEVIALNSKQFITAYTIDQLTGNRVPKHRIFGDNFNFVWPRLAPGVNQLTIYGSGTGVMHFTYRYPMKIGDCTMDLDGLMNC